MAKFSVDELLMNRATPADLPPELLSNAKDLIARVNALMADLGVSKPYKISSGYRPPEANLKAGGALNSPHLVCKAIDIADVGQTLSTLIATKPELLRKHGLFMENPAYTKSWTHLDSVPRKDRPSRIFNP